MSDADFTVDRLIDQELDPTLAEPIKMAFFNDAQGNTNILFTERGNDEFDLAPKLKLYRESTGEISMAALIPADTGPGGRSGEDGATGVVLDPDFENNSWVYLYYTIYDEAESAGYYRLARYNFDGSVLDLNSEAIIIDIPTIRDRAHTGGEMIFDSYGDLWIGVGDNFEPELSSGCFSDLRGSILRIHPLPRGGYTVPAGNYADFIADDFPDVSEALPPEVFAKGLRHPFTMTVHPTERWVGWGDCGPDVGGLTEEHNLATEPGFFGYPYFVGDNTRSMSDQTASAPVDEACTGLTLPPAIPAINSYNHSCAMSGPLFFYDRSIDHSGQLPPHFEGKWILGDIHWDEVRLQSLSKDGKQLAGAQDTNIFNDAQIHRAIDFKIGSDGALYIVNYANNFKGTNQNTNIMRVRYSGPEITEECLGAAGVPQVASIDPVDKKNNMINIRGAVLTLATNHAYRLLVTGTSGRVLFSERSRGPATIDISHKVPPGVHVVNIEFAEGISEGGLVSVLP